MTTKRAHARARQAIRSHAVVACEVATEHGQILGNVAHMSWFVAAVAQRIQEEGAA